MPASDLAITSLPVQQPTSDSLFPYVIDPGGLPAARACNIGQMVAGAFTGGNIRLVNGYLEIYVEDLDEWQQIRARANADDVAELYLLAPTAAGGEGGEALAGEGGEVITEE
jgi:hypothetical protein